MQYKFCGFCAVAILCNWSSKERDSEWVCNLLDASVKQVADTTSLRVFLIHIVLLCDLKLSYNISPADKNFF